MKVLIFHGYLLRGTGSNVYNASLAQALARLGHEVHLLCQDRERRRSTLGDAAALDGLGDRSTTPTSAACCRSSSATRYEGFEVKTFGELSDAELDRYLEPTSTAVARRRPSRSAASTPRSPTTW